MCAKSLQSRQTLCNPRDRSLSDSSAHGILRARMLEWVAAPFSRDLIDTGIEPESLVSPALAGRFFTISTTNTFKLFLIITWLLEPSTTFNTSQLSWEFTHIRDLEVYVSSALW